MNAQNLDILSGKISRPLPFPISVTSIVDSILYLRNDLYFRQGVSATANTFIQKDSFNKIGLFPANINAGGDWIWTGTATKNGLKLGFSYSSIVYHPTHSFFNLAKKIMRGGIAYRQITTILDPSLVYYWRNIRNLIRFKSITHLQKKYSHPEIKRIKLFYIKVWFIDAALSFIKIVGILISYFDLNHVDIKKRKTIIINSTFLHTNPYQQLFYHAITQNLYAFKPSYSDANFLKILKTKASVFHIHWCRANESNVFAWIYDLLQFTLLLIICKTRGIQIWWTAHNLIPHDSKKYFYQ